jgi:hypothetical protein
MDKLPKFLRKNPKVKSIEDEFKKNIKKQDKNPDRLPEFLRPSKKYSNSVRKVNTSII